MRVQVVQQVDVLGAQQAGHGRRQLRHQPLQAEGQKLQRHLAGLDLGQVEQVVQQVQQRFRRVLAAAQVVQLLRGHRRLHQQLVQTQNAIHRRAQFVAHIGQEGAFGNAGGLRLARTFQQLGVQLFQQPMGAFDFRQVEHEHVEPQHHAIAPIRDVTRQRMPEAGAVRLGNIALKALFLTLQRAQHPRLVLCEKPGSEHLGHGRAGNPAHVQTEPLGISPVAVAKAQIGVQVSGQGGHGIHRVLQVTRGQLRTLNGLVLQRDIELYSGHPAWAAVLAAL